MEDRYKMALEAIATMYIPVVGGSVDYIMQKIAKQALENTFEEKVQS